MTDRKHAEQPEKEKKRKTEENWRPSNMKNSKSEQCSRLSKLDLVSDYGLKL